MESGNVPRILVRILGHTFPIMLDSGAQVSFLPLKMAKSLQPSRKVPSETYEVGTYGTANVFLRGPVPLSIQICGIKILHLFCIIDADAPPLVGYDLMSVAHLVIDVSTDDAASAVDRFDTCLTDVEAWLRASRLRLNPTKTRVMWLGSSQQLAQLDICAFCRHA